MPFGKIHSIMFNPRFNGNFRYPAVFILFLALITFFCSCNNQSRNLSSPNSVNISPSQNSSVSAADISSSETPTQTNPNPIDGSLMILIPAGEFVMGAKDDDTDAKANEKPAHKVYLDSYYIYKHEVTYRQFKKFLDSTGYKPLGNWSRGDKPERQDHPVMYITYPDAVEYCKWAKVDLPTEAQWEKAARGSYGRKYPWGNDWDPEKCNNIELTDKDIMAKMADIHNKRGTVPVGSIPGDISPYGVMDMGGNINEWCRDWYKSGYYKKSPANNPSGPQKGTEKSTRGGAWSMGSKRCRATSRWSGSVESDLDDYGFRCVKIVNNKTSPKNK